jgi:uncharacterized protein DUF4071
VTLEGAQPFVFVAMPFGCKDDPDHQFTINFDEIFDRAIRPAAEAAGVRPIRAHEESGGGFVQARLYERLLLAPIVIADLTLSSPNVFYELGIRHAARPRSTIPIVANVSQLPFDVGPIRAIVYELEHGTIGDEQVRRLVALLVSRLEDAKSDSASADSPLFQLFPGLRQHELSHEVTESYRDRAVQVAGFREELRRIRGTSGGDGASALYRDLEKSLRPLGDCPHELMLDLLMAYRGISDWQGMVRWIEQLPADLARADMVQEQLGFALNRRKGPGDRERAIQILEQLIRDRPTPERCGILGRVFKDLYEELRSKDRGLEAAAALRAAIGWYAKGFEADPRDYYPGLNALTLSLLQPGDEAAKRVQELTPVVAFAIARRGGATSNDYWDVASALAIAAIGRDWDLAENAAGRLCVLNAEAWMLETTIGGLQTVKQWLERSAPELSSLSEILGALSRRAAELPRVSSESN